MAKYEDYNLPMNMVQKMTGMSQDDYRKYVKYDSSCSDIGKGVPIFALLKVMHSVIHTSGLLRTTKATVDEESIKMNYQLSIERLQKERINNQSRIGYLIPKKQAYSRVIKFIYSFVNMFKNNIGLASVRISEKSNLSKREANEILTIAYNDSVKFFKENAQILSWDEDGVYSVLRTRLDTLQKIDEEMEKELQEMTNVESELEFEEDYEIPSMGDDYE